MSQDGTTSEIVPTLWPGATVVCVGGGPSVTREDVRSCAAFRTIAINDAYLIAPWADALYAADRKWIDWHDGVPSFAGLKYSIESHETTKRRDWRVLRNTGMLGVETDPSGLRTGFNGGYQAINLAVHLGARRIVLLGYDMIDGEQTHWFGDHPDREPSPFPQMRVAFESLVDPLIALGVDVVNCSPRTALTAFRRAPLAATIVESLTGCAS